jgi:hypothetical protein
MSLAQPDKPLALALATLKHALAHALALALAPVWHSACLWRSLINLSHSQSHTHSHSHRCDIVHVFGAA